MIFGKRLILAEVCLTGLLAGIIYTWPSGLFAQVADGKTQICLSEQEQVFILNSMTIFKLVGSLLTAYLMEKHGRRMTLIVISILNALSWAASFLGSTVLWFYLSEALRGIFINAYVSVIPVVVGETIGADVRGAVTILTNVFVSIGRISMSLLAQTNYTLYNSIPAIPSLAMVVLVLMMKETPYFSMLKQGKEKARERFIWLNGHCDEVDLSRMEDRIQLLNSKKLGFKELFRRNTKKSLGLVVIFTVLSKISGYNTISGLVSYVLPKSSISSSTAILILAIAGLFSTIISMFLIDRLGRRPLSFISFLGAGIAFFLVAIWYYIHEQTSLDTDSTLLIPMIMFGLVEVFSNLGSQQLFHILIGELFTVDVSGRASMLVTISAASSLILFNQSFYPVKQAFGMATTMFICSGFNIIGCICVYVFLIETKGKTLEEIQNQISRTDAPASQVL